MHFIVVISVWNNYLFNYGKVNCIYIHSFIAFYSHTSCNWILKHEYKRSIKLIQYIHIKYTTIRDAPMG